MDIPFHICTHGDKSVLIHDFRQQTHHTHTYIYTYGISNILRYVYTQIHVKTFLFLCIHHVYIKDCYLFLVFLFYEYTGCSTICVLPVNSRFLKIFGNKNPNTKILSLNGKHL